jgi:hypothetical protein
MENRQKTTKKRNFLSLNTTSFQRWNLFHYFLFDSEWIAAWRECRSFSGGALQLPCAWTRPTWRHFRGSWLKVGKSAREIQREKFEVFTQSVDFVEDRDGDSDSDQVVAPDPVVLDVVLQRELGDFRREGVWILHWASGNLCWCFGHRACLLGFLLKGISM